MPDPVGHPAPRRPAVLAGRLDQLDLDPVAPLRIADRTVHRNVLRQAPVQRPHLVARDQLPDDHHPPPLQHPVDLPGRPLVGKPFPQRQVLDPDMVAVHRVVQEFRGDEDFRTALVRLHEPTAGSRHHQMPGDELVRRQGEMVLLLAGRRLLRPAHTFASTFALALALACHGNS